MKMFTDPATRAAWIYGQQMAPCPRCGAYNMKPQMPIRMEGLSENPSAAKILGAWARAMKDGNALLEGPCYYACFDCGHKGPAVDCTGRSSEDANKDPALNAEMKRLWNEQKPKEPPR